MTLHNLLHYYNDPNRNRCVGGVQRHYRVAYYARPPSHWIFDLLLAEPQRRNRNHSRSLRCSSMCKAIYSIEGTYNITRIDNVIQYIYILYTIVIYINISICRCHLVPCIPIQSPSSSSSSSSSLSPPSENSFQCRSHFQIFQIDDNRSDAIVHRLLQHRLVPRMFSWAVLGPNARKEMGQMGKSELQPEVSGTHVGHLGPLTHIKHDCFGRPAINK